MRDGGDDLLLTGTDAALAGAIDAAERELLNRWERVRRALEVSP